MRYGSGVGQNGASTQVAPETRFPVSAAVKEIPYDYVATFKLTGDPSKRTQDVITISTEGVFVAVSVGYSFVPDFRAVGMPVAGSFPLLEPLLAQLFTPADEFAVLRSVAHSLLLRAAEFEFKYSIVDSGSGRELQNQAIHSIAGLGSADGNRPFRPFARPALFLPRSSIRIEIEELSEGPLFKNGTLFIVLHGYKRLGE